MKRLKILLLLVFLLLSVAVVVWNNGAISLDQIDENYVGRFYHGEISDKTLNLNGVKIFKTWIETRTRPVYSPINILWQHLWYNCITEGYDQVIWVESAANISKRCYAAYISGQTVFLRVEYDGWNQVLHSDFTADDLERELSNHFAPLAAEAFYKEGSSR